ncbi:MAG: hypothetical protein F4Y44_07705 [Chloroflexi bacterium]|nr:hypothetical protein [Chloroflexota bacterium]
MEETKIWAIEGTSATQLNTTNRMETEDLLEDILTANADMLEGSLQLVGGRLRLRAVRSTCWAWTPTAGWSCSS